MRCSQILIGSKHPYALKIPTRRAEYSLAESASSPIQAEPTQLLEPVIHRNHHTTAHTATTTAMTITVSGQPHSPPGSSTAATGLPRLNLGSVVGIWMSTTRSMRESVVRHSVWAVNTAWSCSVSAVSPLKSSFVVIHSSESCASSTAMR